jgi:hypothetical protein
MSVLEILTEEHVLLKRFIGEAGCAGAAGAEAPDRERSLLLAFFSALERHEDFEREVFDRRPGSERLAFDHRLLGDLRAEILRTLKAGRVERAPILKTLIDAFSVHLRAHLAWEEECLWPDYAPPTDPGAESALESHARGRLARLMEEVAACAAPRATGSAGNAAESSRR